MIPLTNPFSDPIPHFEAQSQASLSPSISRRERENRVIDAVTRVIKIRLSACVSMKPICCKAIKDLAQRPCFLAEYSLICPTDMLIVAARFMDVFNECLASRMVAKPIIHNGSTWSMASILDDDFSIDLSPPASVASLYRFSLPGNSESFWEEQKVVQELLEFGRE